MEDIKKYKQALLNTLYTSSNHATTCPLESLGRKNVVFGEGNPDASLLFLGEAPGRDEDIQGRPFVGRSGKLLDTILELANIKREAVFITNIVKCRPPNNRKPTMHEMTTCKNLLLLNQIKIIRPRIICTLGASALEGLFEQPVKISKARGIIKYLQGIVIIPTYHPAYILRNPSELKTLVHDIKKAVSLSI